MCLCFIHMTRMLIYLCCYGSFVHINDFLLAFCGLHRLFMKELYIKEGVEMRKLLGQVNVKLYSHMYSTYSADACEE